MKNIGHRNLLPATEWFSMEKVAQMLNIGITRNDLFKVLRNRKILDSQNIPSQVYRDKGYFRVMYKKIEELSGEYVPVTQVSAKGIAFLRKVMGWCIMDFLNLQNKENELYR